MHLLHSDAATALVKNICRDTRHMKGDIRRFRSRDEGGAPVVLQTRAEMAAEEAELGVGRLTGEVAEVGRSR